MAEAFTQVAQDQFRCPVCLDLLKDPVTLPCGRSYCKVCINDCWDQEDDKGVYSCPQCRDTFTPRPVLCRNNRLAEVVEKLKKTEVQAASPAQCYTGPGDVECEYCSGRKHKAIKSCLVCLTSFCETHLKPHLELPGLKKHTLIEASTNLQEKICSQHDKLIEIYCRTDQRCICSSCMLDNHKGHNAVLISAERADRQSELKEEQMKTQQRIQEKQNKVQELKQAVNMIKSRAQTAVENSERIFTEMISSIEKKHLEVTEQIRSQEKAELSRTEQLLEQLEQEITDLNRRVTEMEQLSHTHDHIQFLRSFQFLCVSSEHEVSPSITVHQHLQFDGVMNSLSDLKKHFEEFCLEEFNKIPPHAASYPTLDSKTAKGSSGISGENKVVKYTTEQPPYSDYPDKFDSSIQVSEMRAVIGHVNWKLNWNGHNVTLSAFYDDSKKKKQGRLVEFCLKSRSLSLSYSTSSFSINHDDIKIKLTLGLTFLTHLLTCKVPSCHCGSSCLHGCR